MSLSFTPPLNGAVTSLPPPYAATSPPSTSSSSTSTSIIIVIIVIASAVIVSASIYLLLRFLSRRFHRSFRTFSAADDVVSRPSEPQNQHQFYSNNLLDSLPIFTFRSVTGNLTGADCAVCLSKFEPHDQLRLLPLCCHAFHAECIDTWIVANQTCPLCRSTVLPSDSDVLDKILNSENNRNNSFRDGNSNSFRIEIGSISRRLAAGEAAASPENHRSFSIGSFEYILDENGYEISTDSIHSRGVSECATDKESSVNIPATEENLAADVGSGGGRNWLRDYVDRLASMSSRTVSFRSSGRFFTGSSRRTDNVIAAGADDLEANRVGEEITELFRWLSGV